MLYGTFKDDDDGMQDSMLRRIQWVTPDERDEIAEEERWVNRVICALTTVLTGCVVTAMYFY